MSKRTSAKYKIDRRMGENIWGRAKSPFNTRSYGPGEHGQRHLVLRHAFGQGRLQGFAGVVLFIGGHRVFEIEDDGVDRQAAGLVQRAGLGTGDVEDAGDARRDRAPDRPASL